MSEAIPEAAPVEATPEAPAEVPEGAGDAPENLLEAIEAGETEAPQTFSLKIDGEDQEITLEALKTAYGKDRASGKRFEEAAEMRKAAESDAGAIQQLAHMLQNGSLQDRVQALAHLSGGTDRFSQLLHEIQSHQAAYQQMSEPEREAHDYKSRLEQYEEAEHRRVQSEQQRHLAAETNHWTAELPKQFAEALTAEGVRVSPYKIQRMASLAHHYLENGEAIDAKVLARVIKKESAISSQIGEDLGGEDLLSELGPDVIKRIEKAFVGRYKKSNPTPKAASRGTSNGQTARQLTSKEWFALPMDER